MVGMFRRSLFRLTIVLAAIGLALSSLAANGQDTDRRGRKYKAPPPTARIEVTVLRAFNDKPVENAAVVFHPMEGEKDKGNMELKTNEDGKTVIDVLAIGSTVRLQVIARGFQTFGQDYKIDSAKMAIEVKLNRPGEDYSIYKPHPKTIEGGQSVVTDQQGGTTPDKQAGASAAPAKDKGAAGEKKDTKDKPADTSKTPDAQASPSQTQPK